MLTPAACAATIGRGKAEIKPREGSEIVEQFMSRSSEQGGRGGGAILFTRPNP